MKKYILIFVILLSNLIYSQDDYEEIIFNAKLLTISKHNLISKNDLISKIDKIPFKSYNNDDYVFVIVKSKYYCLDSRIWINQFWCDCDYYLCYSKKKKAFYLLGGFEKTDIDDFAIDFQNTIYYDWESVFQEKVLKDFITHIILKKNRKAKKCFKVCKETYD